MTIGTQSSLRSIVPRAALYACIWWALTGGAADGWQMGIVAVALATAVSTRLSPRPRPLALARLPRFVAYFLFHSVHGALQVVAMVLHPRMPLQPAMREVRLHLQSVPARVLLANIVNLMPGTLSVGLEGERLRLHVLSDALPIEDTLRDAERQVAALFGESLP